MEGKNMVKTKCVCESFYATDTKEIERFINEFLDKYEVVDVNQIGYTTNNVYINVTIIYKEDVFDNNEKELLKEIIKLDHISINVVQNALSIGFNRASILISILEDNKIISDKKDGRKLLMNIDDANKLIDSLDLNKK